MSKALQILKSEKVELERELKKINKAIEILDGDSPVRTRNLVPNSEKKQHFESLLDLIGKEPGLNASQLSNMLNHTSEGYTYGLLRVLTKHAAIRYELKNKVRRYYLAAGSTRNDQS